MDNKYKLQKISFFILISCLIAIFFSGFDAILAKARDAKRLADMKLIQKSLEIYFDKHGSYPMAENDWQGWDLTYEIDGGPNNFIEPLFKEGITDKNFEDPLNNETFFYRYKRFPKNSYGCEKPFIVLQLMSFELATSKIGRGSCSEIDWTNSAPNGYTIMMRE